MGGTSPLPCCPIQMFSSAAKMISGRSMRNECAGSKEHLVTPGTLSPRLCCCEAWRVGLPASWVGQNCLCVSVLPSWISTSSGKGLRPRGPSRCLLLLTLLAGLIRGKVGRLAEAGSARESSLSCAYNDCHSHQLFTGHLWHPME